MDGKAGLRIAYSYQKLPVRSVSQPQLQIPAMKRGMMTPRSPQVSNIISKIKQRPLMKAGNSKKETSSVKKSCAETTLFEFENGNLKKVTKEFCWRGRGGGARRAPIECQ